MGQIWLVEQFGKDRTSLGNIIATANLAQYAWGEKTKTEWDKGLYVLSSTRRNFHSHHALMPRSRFVNININWSQAQKPQDEVVYVGKMFALGIASSKWWWLTDDMLGVWAVGSWPVLISPASGTELCRWRGRKYKPDVYSLC